MSEWRPEEGWNKKRADFLNNNTVLAISIENKAIYEAGADAILGALREYRPWRGILASLENDEPGHWLFIPDTTP